MHIQSGRAFQDVCPDLFFIRTYGQKSCVFSSVVGQTVVVTPADLPSGPSILCVVRCRVFCLIIVPEATQKTYNMLSHSVIMLYVLCYLL